MTVSKLPKTAAMKRGSPVNSDNLTNTMQQGCRIGVPGLWILVQGRSRSLIFLSPGVGVLSKKRSPHRPCLFSQSYRR